MTRSVFRLDEAHGGTLEEAKALVGGKAANLGVMTRDLGLPVPPGFAITTGACRAFLANAWPAGLDDEIRDAMTAVEGAVGRRFGDPSDPLLVSVRSGAPVSMPGMMDTILDLGLNARTTRGLGEVAGDPAFAQACHRRFVASFRSIVGLDDVPDDPWRQLRLGIEAVFRSWESDRARSYRQREGIPDDLGTAVTIQAMVFGNRGSDSATGVLFTRNPATGEPTLYGDVLFDAQGEDVVAGTHRTEPIAVLDARLPAVANELRGAAERLERHYTDLCDIEFTIEDGRLWLLQVRIGRRSPQAALRIAVDMAEDPAFPLTRADAVARVAGLLADPPTIVTGRGDAVSPIATGLAASPGFATGRIATTADAAVLAAETGHAAILVRPATSPDDVHGMSRAAGVLTASGGLASHAAVVARGWGIPAVVGAAAVALDDDEVTIGGRRFRDGDPITIDGATGEVFDGEVRATREVVPEAGTLLSWAEELGIVIGERTARSEPASPPATARRVNLDDAVRVLATKGFATSGGFAEAVLAQPETAQPLLDQLVADGLASIVAGAVRLTEAGRARAVELLDADRAAWGADAATAALDAFLAIDRRVKDIVTAWQMRDDQTVNDHADAEYDAAILDRLVAAHREAMSLLQAAGSELPRFADYGERLGRALAAAREGDGRFVASPRVDSYHGIWFELHEDLIRLAGRTREEETAAGRA